MEFNRKLQKGGRISLPKELMRKLGLTEGKSNLTIRVQHPGQELNKDYDSAATWYITITSADAEVSNEI